MELIQNSLQKYLLSTSTGIPLEVFEKSNDPTRAWIPAFFISFTPEIVTIISQ